MFLRFRINLRLAELIIIEVVLLSSICTIFKSGF